jgi:hypothetical protein
MREDAKKSYGPSQFFKRNIKEKNDSYKSSNDTRKESHTNTEIEQIFINANKLAPWKEEEVGAPEFGQIKP